MKKNRKLSRMLMTVLCFAAPLVAGVLTQFGQSGSQGVFVFYLTLLLAALGVGYISLSTGERPTAFGAMKNRKTALCAALLALGYFAEFVSRSVAFYLLLPTRSVATVSLVCRVVTALCALLAALYFALTAMSLSGERYDFRALKILHIVPLVWALGRMLEWMEQGGVALRADAADDVLRYLMLSASLLFFYFFAREVQADTASKKATILFAAELACTALPCSACSVMKAVSAPSLSGVLLAFTALTLFLFGIAYFADTAFTKTEN